MIFLLRIITLHQVASVAGDKLTGQNLPVNITVPGSTALLHWGLINSFPTMSNFGHQVSTMTTYVDALIYSPKYTDVMQKHS